MWLLLGPKGTVTKYGRYTANGGHPKELHMDVSNNILTGITEIAGANHGACAINGVGKLYRALVDTATFYRIPRIELHCYERDLSGTNGTSESIEMAASRSPSKTHLFTTLCLSFFAV
jgi:hypothetical protein